MNIHLLGNNGRRTRAKWHGFEIERETTMKRIPNIHMDGMQEHSVCSLSGENNFAIERALQQ